MKGDVVDRNARGRGGQPLSLRVVAFRVLALVGLGFSAALVTDELTRVPTFCSFQNGCAAITSSLFGRLFGIPLSIIGLLAFGIFFLFTLFPRTQGRVAGNLALVAGIGGLFLAGVQLIVLRQICRLCFVVDAAAILLAAVEVRFPGQKASEFHEGRGKRGIWGVLALVALLLPFAWSAWRPEPEIPAEVAETWKAGKINIVEITSFTCPYCRRTHQELARLRKEHGDHLNFVRLVAASPGNEGGITAARSYHCALRQGLGEAMADRLVAMDSYSRDRLREVAVEVGLNPERFDADWSDPALEGEIASTYQWVARQEITGVPQIWVQEILLVGDQSYEQLVAAVERAVPSAHE